MGFAIFIKKQAEQRLKIWITVAGLTFPFLVYCQGREVKITQQNLNKPPYISAFTSRTDGQDSLCRTPAWPTEIVYTIQLCTFDQPLRDGILPDNKTIHVIRMGDLYRYLFSGFSTLREARQQLARIRSLFPQACIREYKKGKLGQVTDTNINY